MKKLNKELVKTLIAGDVLTYQFDTELNGLKTEDCIFIQASSCDENLYDRAKTEPKNIPSLVVRNISMPGVKYEICDRTITIPTELSGNDYAIWTNGWNIIYVTHINGVEV